jgi:hypothetical protein
MWFGGCAAVLLFGLLGLAWWLWRHRAGSQPAARFPRVRTGLVAAGLVIIAVGTVGRLVDTIEPVPSCSPPGGAQGATRGAPSDASLVAQEAATWPETGIGLLYSRASDARICLSPAQDYYVAVHTDNIAGARAMTLGDIVLMPVLTGSRERLRALAGHEAQHRVQWAVGTVIGGPLAFPIAYAIDDFFFPGDRNHFERMAGLEAGGYAHVGTGPVLGPAQFAVLGVLAASIVVAVFAVWRRRASRRSRSDAGTPAVATDPGTPGAATDRGMTGGLARDE